MGQEDFFLVIKYVCVVALMREIVRQSLWGQGTRHSCFHVSRLY